MTANADVLLFAYTLIVVGAVTGAQMLYYGAMVKKPMWFGGNQIGPPQLTVAGSIFSIVGALALAVTIVEILAGAAGPDVRVFAIATIIVPPAVLFFNAYQRREPRPPAA